MGVLMMITRKVGVSLLAVCASIASSFAVGWQFLPAKAQTIIIVCSPGELEMMDTAGVVVGCTPDPSQQPAPPPAPPRPVPYAAVAWHPDASDVWVAAMYPDQGSARSAAIEQCSSAMGEGCQWTWQTGRGYIGVARAPNGSIFVGTDLNRTKMQKSMAETCKDYIVGCTPIGMFHTESEFRPARRRTGDNIRYPKDPQTLRKLYGALAGGIGDHFFMAGGHSSAKEAEDQALAACRATMSSAGNCTSLTWTGNGYITIFKGPSDDRLFMIEQTLDRRDAAVTKYCSDRKWKCTLERTFDVRRPGVFTYKRGM
jgi:hypothetical protein